MDETPSPTPQEPGDAWFTFLGRVIAQIVGAIASIVLAIFFLQKAQSGNDATSSALTSTPATRTAPTRSDGRITLAVLPLSNYSGDPAQDYFVDGMTEALIADLAQLEGLRVISRTSVMQYRTQQKPLPQFASELGADMIVEGSVVRDGDRARVTAQLIHSRFAELITKR